MFRYIRPVYSLHKRTFNTFGHKRVPEPTITVLWHGFLTFTFIGLTINWKRIGNYIFEDVPEDEDIMKTEIKMPEHVQGGKISTELPVVEKSTL